MLVPAHNSSDTFLQHNPSDSRTQINQNIIFQFLKQQLQEQHPEKVISSFRSLFIKYEVCDDNTHVIQNIFQLLVANRQSEFNEILKYSCYLLIHDWVFHNHEHYIKELLELFTNPTHQLDLHYSKLTGLKKWIADFVQSQDYQDLKLFTYHLEDTTPENWINRHSNYLLIQKYFNQYNLNEQREAAYKLAQKIECKFKFSLAQYISHLHLSSQWGSRIKNPTNLGDEMLRLIPLIIPKRGACTYQDLASIFLKQIHKLSYGEFKKSLQKYLLFFTKNKKVKQLVYHKLSSKLLNFENTYNINQIDSDLLIKTCTRIIDYLTIEDGHKPSELFILLMSYGNPLILAILLLKISLVAPSTKIYMKLRLAQLLEYYHNHLEDDCWWVIYFFEFSRIIFAIHADAYQYTLIPIKGGKDAISSGNIQDYRVFIQPSNRNRFDSDFS